METKANHVLIGSIVIIVSVLFVTFLMWFSQIDINGKKNEYLILFEGSVTGLRVNESVRYQGIPIGEVREIGVDRENIDLVRVLVNIDQPQLIRENSIASIEAQGLTGYTFIEIRAGDEPGPIIKAKPGQKYPVIPSRPSNIEILFSKAPKILESFLETLEGAKKLLNEQNRMDFAQALQNLRKITDKLDKGSNSLELVMGDLRASLAVVKQASTKIDNHIEGALLDISKASKNVQKSMDKFDTAADEFEKILVENRDSIKNFTNYGLKDFSKFIAEARETIDSFTQIARDIERSPTAFLHKSTDDGYKIQQ